MSAGTRTHRIGIFGPHLGGNEGWVTSQGEVLRSLLIGAGHEIIDASDRPRRVPRAVDTVATIIRTAKSFDAAIVAVFSGSGFAMAELTFSALRAFRVPTALVLHGGNLPAFSALHPRRVRRLLSSAAAVVAPSHFLAEALSPFRSDISVISNALPLDAYPASTRSPARPRLLWMRAFHPIYRPELALEVIAVVRRQCPDATLTMAGQDKGLLEVTKRRAGELGLHDVVEFPGFLDPEAKYHAFERHDIFLSTNAIDNAPVSVLEAAASGLVIIGMDAGGISHLLTDQHSAMVVADGDVHAMAQAITTVLADHDCARRLSGGARLAAEVSAGARVAETWVALLGSMRRQQSRLGD